MYECMYVYVSAGMYTRSTNCVYVCFTEFMNQCTFSSQSVSQSVNQSVSQFFSDHLERPNHTKKNNKANNTASQSEEGGEGGRGRDPSLSSPLPLLHHRIHSSATWRQETRQTVDYWQWGGGWRGGQKAKGNTGEKVEGNKRLGVAR